MSKEVTSTDNTVFIPPKNTGSGLKPGETVNGHYAEYIRRLIVLGNEGVGKTRLINALCDSNFTTSNASKGCPIEDKQIGSFMLDNWQIDLVDMVGINCEDQGEWRKKLEQRADVHGVIFFVFGSNPRDTAHGLNLFRFIEYCKNIGVPTLILYEGQKLPQFENSNELCKVIRDPKLPDESYRLTNSTEVKKTIVRQFESAQKLFVLMDPVDFCKHIQDLNNRIEQLQKKLTNEQADYSERVMKLEEEIKNKDEVHKGRLEEEKQRYEKEINERRHENERLSANLSELTDKIGQLAQSVRQKDDKIDNLKTQNVEKQTENDRLINEKQQLEHETYNLTQQTRLLQTQKRELDATQARLRRQQRAINRYADRMKTYFDQHINEIGDIVNHKKSHIKAKRYNSSKLKAILPFIGLWIIEDYNRLCERLEKIMNFLIQGTIEIKNKSGILAPEINALPLGDATTDRLNLFSDNNDTDGFAEESDDSA